MLEHPRESVHERLLVIISITLAIPRDHICTSKKKKKKKIVDARLTAALSLTLGSF